MDRSAHPSIHPYQTSQTSPKNFQEMPNSFDSCALKTCIFDHNLSEVMSNHFSLWLGKKLTELGTDDSVFGPYIISILEVNLLGCWVGLGGCVNSKHATGPILHPLVQQYNFID